MRRHDLDWLRVLVFGLLIIYHVGMFFVPWGWHIKNNVISDDMRWPMLFVNQWRLASLFLISGMGTRFALSKRSSSQYVKERLVRLLIPLGFGMLFIIPPQVYVERLAYAGYTDGYLYYWMHDAFRGIYPEGNVSWHHLWFLPYLLLFSVVLTPLFIYLRDHPDCKFLERQRRLLDQSHWHLLWYMIPLFLAEALVEPFFEVTHALIGDWFTIVLYIFIFFYGYNFISIGPSFWSALHRIKNHALILGVICFAIYFYLIFLEDSVVKHFIEAGFKTFNMWAWMLVIFGYGAAYLNKPSKLLSYCNTAVYPFYILHQTVTVVLAYYVFQLDWSIFSKFIFLMMGTFLITGGLYELVRRVKPLRPLFGLK